MSMSNRGADVVVVDVVDHIIAVTSRLFPIIAEWRNREAVAAQRY